MRRDNIQRHKNGNQCKTIICDICNDTVPYIRKNQHKNDHKRDHSRINNARSILPIEIPPFSTDPDYEDIYTTFRKHIESYVKNFQLSCDINFQLESFNNQAIAEAFKSVYNSQTEGFKISVSFSYILLNKETNELAFYTASRNNQRLFDDTYLINCDNDFTSMYDRILGVDLQRCVLYPNTKFVYVKTTNVVFFLTKMLGNPIGAEIVLPNYLKYNKGLVSLVKSANNAKKPYSDNLCFFRALALFRGYRIDGLETETKRLFKTYCRQALINPAEFKGICLDQLEELSRIFDIGINVYFQKENRDTELLFRTIKQDNILYLNLFKNHFSYISDFQKYTNRYRCSKCIKILSHVGNYRRHIKSCDGTTRKIFSNGVFRLPSTIFEQLELYGINIPHEKRIYKYRITFDCEVFLTRDDTPSDTAKVEFSHTHHLASISVCSNVPAFEDPKCFISNGSPKQLVKEAVKYMLSISETSTSLLNEYYSDYLDQINETPLRDKFGLYLRQIPVLGFNNSKYDIKVMRDYLVSVLLELDTIQFVIKKSTQYNCILTGNLRFLDICNFIAPGFDYDSFLKAYGASASKSWFPYEWFDDLKKLTNTEFPLYEDFYSKLKSKITLEPAAEEMLSNEEMCVVDRRPSINKPLQPQEKERIGRYRYQKIKEMFIGNNWTMREYLQYYNNMDTKPFVEALKNLSSYYTARGCDIFKDGVSGMSFSVNIITFNVEFIDQR